MPALTERILDRLPGRRWAWVLGWGLLAWPNAGMWLMLQASGRARPWESPVAELLDRAAFMISVPVALFGAAKLVRQVRVLAPGLSRLVDRNSEAGVTDLFRLMGSTVGPLFLTLVATVVFAIDVFVREGWPAATVTAVSWLLLGPPLWTFFWVYVSVQVGLHALGGRRLELDAHAGDRTLGLWPWGTWPSPGSGSLSSCSPRS